MASAAVDPDRDVASSIERGESVADWWNRAHANNEQLWISGTPPVEIWARLTVMHLIRPGVRVLNIGVGTGLCTRALQRDGAHVSVLDISRKALANVADVANGWLASELELIPSNTFDLALSHLVAQHMSNADLERQMQAIFRALKPSGIFAIQYAQTWDDAESANDNERGVKAGGVLRSPAFFAQMVERAGGMTLWDQARERWVATWRVAHLARAHPQT